MFSSARNCRTVTDYGASPWTSTFLWITSTLFCLYCLKRLTHFHKNTSYVYVSFSLFLRAFSLWCCFLQLFRYFVFMLSQFYCDFLNWKYVIYLSKCIKWIISHVLCNRNGYIGPTVIVFFKNGTLLYVKSEMETRDCNFLSLFSHLMDGFSPLFSHDWLSEWIKVNDFSLVSFATDRHWQLQTGFFLFH